MGRALHFNDGAAWRRARALWIHDGAAWRKARAVYVHDGAAWRQSAASQPVNFGGRAADYFVGMIGSSACSCSIDGDGNVSFSGSDSGPNTVWYDAPVSGIGAQHWIRATLVSGQSPNSGAALNAWLSLSGGQWWGYSTSQQGAAVGRSGTIRFDISSDAAGSAIVCSGTVDFSAFREA